MDNPFRMKMETITNEDAKRIVEVTEAYAILFEALEAHCTNPSRYLSLAITLLEQSQAMAVKSIHKEALP